MFWVDIENAADEKLGDGPIATGIRWRYRQKLSRAGEWELEVPLTEPRLAYATLKRRLHCWILRGDGVRTWRGGGIIESRRYGLSAGGIPTMTLSGPDMLRELAGVTVNFAVNALDTPPLGESIFEQIFAAVPAWHVLGVSGLGATGIPEFTARFVHESVLNALVACCEKTGTFFWLDDYFISPRDIIVGGGETAPPNSGRIATNLADTLAVESNNNIVLINDIERIETSWDATNRLIVYGAGEGQARLTLAMATLWPDGSAITTPYVYTDIVGRAHTFACDKATNTITDTQAVTDYGQFEQALAFKEIGPVTASDADMIAAANTLVTAAVNHLILSSQPQNAYRLSIAALRGDISVGQRIRVVARKVSDDTVYINIDENLMIQEIGYEIDAQGERVTDLVVATTWKAPESSESILVDAIRKVTAFEAHPQIGASENTLCYRDDIDDDYGASFPFWLSRGTLQVNSVTLRFKLDRLRSTVKTIGGTATGTVDLPGHTHDIDLPDHDHDLEISSDPGGFARIVYIDVTDNKLYYDGIAGPTLATTSEEGGGGSETSDSGGSTVGTTLDISSALSTEYGIYEDVDAPYAVGDLAWTVNAVTVVETPVGIAGGWYELDITEYLIDTNTLRPVTSGNTVAVSIGTPALKRVRVTAQIELRTTIQTLAAV